LRGRGENKEKQNDSKTEKSKKSAAALRVGAVLKKHPPWGRWAAGNGEKAGGGQKHAVIQKRGRLMKKKKKGETGGAGRMKRASVR